MASIKNSLRKIYTALGGNNSKSKTITGLLDDISTVASSGGSGGGDIIIVTANLSYNNGTYTVNSVSHTYDEIVALVNDGKTVCANCGINSGYGVMYYMLNYFSNAYDSAMFKNIYNSTGLKELKLTISQNGENSFVMDYIIES